MGIATATLLIAGVGALGLVLSQIRGSTLAKRRRAEAFSDPRYLN